MERVVSINLNGNSYQLDESAYDALRAYLSGAETALADNPDKGEIVRDLEQAVADKCASHLSAHKSVVSGAEMQRVLAEMGPVEGGDEKEQRGESSASSDGARPQRRLYRIYGRGAWTGVSAGLAAYTGLDVAWVRVLWILSALFTGGFAALIYVVLIFAMPIASTSEEMAAAHGAPFNAQEVIDRAQREYTRFTEENAPHWRRQARAWRRSMREQARHWRHSWDWDGVPEAPPAQPVGYITRIFGGLFALVFSVVAAALLIGFLVALFSLLNTGAVLGWTPPGDIPNWLAIVILCIAYAALSSPIRHLRRGSYAAASGLRYRHGGADELITLLAILAGGAIAYQLVPEFRDWMQHLPDAFANFLALFE